jgi:hypothetical protein
MNVFVEPADGTEDSKPIAQLNVTAANYVEGYQVTGVRAVTVTDKPCSLSFAHPSECLTTAFDRDTALGYFENSFEQQQDSTESG